MKTEEYGSISSKLMEIIRKHVPEEVESIENRLGNKPMPTNKRTMIMLEYFLHKYYQVDANKTEIEGYLGSMEKMFAQGFGSISLKLEFDKKMDELETMLKKW